MIAIIPARGRSKGLPGKNIRLLNGIPLICYSIKSALQAKSISKVIVSTDDDEIAKIAEECGAEVPFMRPKSLSLDNSPEWLVWRHAINYLENNMNEKTNLVILPSTSPLRSSEDVNMCINEFEKNNAATMKDTFSQTGVKAGTLYFPKVFKIPPAIDTNEIKSIYGKVILNNETVRSNLSGSLLKPGALI